MRYFEAVRIEVFAGGRWHRKTFRPPWTGRPLTDFVVAFTPNLSRKLRVLVAGRWVSKSGCNSNLMAIEREGIERPGAQGGGR